MSVAGLASLNAAAAGDRELVRAARAGEDEAFEALGSTVTREGARDAVPALAGWV